MYLISEMIDLGLKDGQNWPTNSAYRIVAQNVLLCNANIVTRSALIEGVQRILNIPENRIKTITFLELEEFGFDATLILS